MGKDPRDEHERDPKKVTDRLLTDTVVQQDEEQHGHVDERQKVLGGVSDD